MGTTSNPKLIQALADALNGKGTWQAFHLLYKKASLLTKTVANREFTSRVAPGTKLYYAHYTRMAKRTDMHIRRRALRGDGLVCSSCERRTFYNALDTLEGSQVDLMEAWSGDDCELIPEFAPRLFLLRQAIEKLKKNRGDYDC